MSAQPNLTLVTSHPRIAADHVDRNPGMPLDLPGRRAALRILYESGRLAGRGDLACYAVAALHGARESIPQDAVRDATVAAFLLGDYAAAVPLFTADASAMLGFPAVIDQAERQLRSFSASSLA